jgi:predicted peptidase
MHGSGGASVKSVRQADFQEKYPCYVLTPKSKAPWAGSDLPGAAMPEDFEVGALSKPLQKAARRALQREQARAKGTQEQVLPKLLRLVDTLLEAHPDIDRSRIYVIGHSMGGMGSWGAIWERPHFFAAAVPSSGGMAPWRDRSRLTDTPIWAFHGDEDGSVPIEGTADLFDSMKALQGNMKFTVPRGGHSSSQVAFKFPSEVPGMGLETLESSDKCDSTEDVWEWVFRQKRAEP